MRSRGLKSQPPRNQSVSLDWTEKAGWSYFNPLETWKASGMGRHRPRHICRFSSCSDSRERRSRSEQGSSKQKISKYNTLATTHHFVSISVETGGHWNPESSEFIAELGKRISQITLEPLETQFLFQRLSISLQRGNELAFRNTFSAE